MAERTKRCTRCQTVKPWSDFHAYKRWEDGSVRTVQARCKQCDSEYHVEWVRSKSAEKRRHIWRQQREARKRNPERLALHREYQREWARRKRATGSGRVNPRPTETVLTRPTSANAKPFLDWLKSEWDNPNQAAHALGINPRRIQEVWYGRQERLELDTIDRALTNYGRPDLLDVFVPLDKA